MNQYTADEAPRWINDALLTVCCRCEGRWRCYLPLSHSPTPSLPPFSPSCCFPQPLPFLLPHTSDVVWPWSISLCSVKEESDSDGITLVSGHLLVFDYQHVTETAGVFLVLLRPGSCRIYVSSHAQCSDISRSLRLWRRLIGPCVTSSKWGWGSPRCHWP